MSTEEQEGKAKGIDSLNNFYESNKKNINIAAIAVIILMAGVWYYFKQYKPGIERDAKDSFFMAERYYGQDSLNKALIGDGINLGMMDIADEFGSTKTGQQATYYAGRILLQQGKFQEALDYLSDVSMSDEIMAAQVISLQGDCYSELGNYSEAGDRYMYAADKRDNAFSRPIALKKAGEAFEEAAEFDDALDAYKALREEYSETPQAQNIEGKIARVSAKMLSQ